MDGSLNCGNVAPPLSHRVSSVRVSPPLTCLPLCLPFVSPHCVFPCSTGTATLTGRNASARPGTGGRRASSVLMSTTRQGRGANRRKHAEAASTGSATTRWASASVPRTLRGRRVMSARTRSWSPRRAFPQVRHEGWKEGSGRWGVERGGRREAGGENEWGRKNTEE